MGEPMPFMVWIVMPLLIAAGAAAVTGVMMQARLEVATSRQKEMLAEARALLATQHRAMEERVRSCEESARRRALDEFMGDIRVEERQFLQEGKSLSGRKSLVVQERVCFRNIPLTGWIEHEFPAGAAVSHSAPPPGRPEPVLAEVEPIPRRLLG